jgi:hypothetical protein
MKQKIQQQQSEINDLQEKYIKLVKQHQQQHHQLVVAINQEDMSMYFFFIKNF